VYVEDLKKIIQKNVGFVIEQGLLMMISLQSMISLTFTASSNTAY
jgi:hypothetical protein